MGDDVKKELAKVGGQPVLLQTTSRFTELDQISHIVVTSRKADMDEYTRVVGELTTSGTIEVVEGGDTRQESVRLGLEALGSRWPDYVLIHDGARPWVTTKLILSVMAVTMKHGACVPVVLSTNALKRVQDDVCVEHVARDDIYYAQTPQGFIFSEIMAAHQDVAQSNEKFADDAEVYASVGKSVYVTEGDPENRKITHPHDLVMQ